jgi:hypothetical protein
LYELQDPSACLSEGSSGQTAMMAQQARCVTASEFCVSLAENKPLKRILELAYFREYGNRIQTEIRISGFEGRLKLFAIPAQEWVGLLFFFQSGGNGGSASRS